MTRVAAVDIGSNTLLLLVAEDDGQGGARAVVDECRFGRLAQGLSRESRLSDEAIARSLDILREFSGRIAEAGVDRVAAVGTQALREAQNADAFTTAAEGILGAPIEVISGAREAELVALATARSFPALAAGELVICDVGGASTEVIVMAGGQTRSVDSVPIGAVRLTEQHLASDPAGADECRALVADIDRALADLDLPTGAPVVGSAGTATSLAAIELKLVDYDPDRVQGFRIASSSVDRLLARLLELSVAEKKRLRGLEPARADVIAGGAAIYARLLHRVGAAELVVSDRGVRWGLAAELLSL